MTRSVRNQLTNELSKSGIASTNTSASSGSSGSTSSSSKDRTSKLQRALCAGFFMNGAQQCSLHGVYRAVSMPGLEVSTLFYHHICMHCSQKFSVIIRTAFTHCVLVLLGHTSL
jgi:hypothetical protein